MAKTTMKIDGGEADQEQRDRMSAGLDANIAVRAAAGSGKTRSTVDRIVRMALDPAYRDHLPQMVVVTYTNAAADELRTRARKRLIEEHHAELKKLAGEIIPKFGQIFFGTIHSFCMRILGEFGHQIGLPAQLSNLEDDVSAIHDRFRREREERVWESLDRRELLRVLRFGLSFDDLVRIGRELSTLPIECDEIFVRSGLASFDAIREAGRIRLDAGALDGFKVTKSSEKNVRPYQARYRIFCEAWNGDGASGPFVPMPAAAKKGGRDFEARSAELLAGVHDWFARSVLKLGLRFAAEFQAFRRETGCLTYNDQILMTARLVSAHPGVLKTLRARDLRVILDEAQDTTPFQFKILSELTRPVEAGFGDWPGAGSGPQPGHFVMVGDEQQCIYASSGADIACYQRHGAALEPAVFHVTFRCNRAVVEFVNQRFPRILDGGNGQAAFVQLVPRRDAGEGKVGRLILEDEPRSGSEGRPTGGRLFRREAELLARRLKQLAPAGLGAERWSDIAVLMPRNDWLSELAGCLEAEKIPCRMTARRRHRDDAGWRWFVSLLAVLARGDDGYELAGVLREVFGVSDSEMAEWVFAGGKLDLSAELRADSRSAPAEAIRLLQDLRRRMEVLPALAAVDEMLKVTGLVERLRAAGNVPGVRAVSARMPGILRGRAAKAEALGRPWQDLAEELIEEGEKPMPELLPAEGRDGIVLMTCQKAKGQEWPVVILPGLSRPMHPAGNRGKTIELTIDGENLACNVKGAHTFNWDDASGRSRLGDQQQMRRVYYVACTRAKKHLILVDARSLWAAARKWKYLRPIQALSAPDEGDDWMEREVPEWKPMVRQASASEPGHDRVDPAAGAWSRIASLRSLTSLHPSGKDSDRRVEASEDREPSEGRTRRVEPLHGALIYGNWWHDAMFRADWSSSNVAAFLQDAVSELPDEKLRARARAELGLFLAAPLFQDLTAPEAEFHREVPYTRKPDADSIEDGKIDLLYRMPGSPWRIIDWKTDVVGGREEAVGHARDRYAAQMEAYAEAVGSFGLKVRGAMLYFTAIGEWVETGRRG